MIVGYHAVINNDIIWLEYRPISVQKFIVQAVLSGGGWIGNTIFFTISAWFLLDRTQTLRGNLLRIWLMERELLFWSVTLLTVSLIMASHGWIHNHVSVTVIVKSLLPLSTSLWWYPTSYALFLVFCPFLVCGMKSLTKKYHGILALIVTLLWGVLSLVPMLDLNLHQSNVFVMIYWFILITYYRWYMKPLSVRQCCLLIVIGVTLIIVYWTGSNMLTALTGKGLSFQNFLFNSPKLPSMLIGFGLFLLFCRIHFYVSIINIVAKSTFGVYLIHQYPVLNDLLWQRLFLLPRLYSISEFYVFMLIGSVVSVFILSLMLDLVRQIVFFYTVDRAKSSWFNALWTALSSNSLIRYCSRILLTLNR